MVKSWVITGVCLIGAGVLCCTAAIGAGALNQQRYREKLHLTDQTDTPSENFTAIQVALKDADLTVQTGESVSVEAENILAFTGDCDYNVRFLGMGVVSQKGIATSTLTGRGDSAYVAVLSDGNPLVMNNRKSRATISVDPDAVICWMGQEGDNCDPQIRTDINWKTLIGQASGESYAYEWGGNQPVTVIVQPSERKGGIRLAID